MKRYLKPLLKVVAAYFIFGVAWIRFSDKILMFYTDDLNQITNLQTYKGTIFVGISTVIIYITLMNEMMKMKKSDAEKIKANNLVNALISSTDALIGIKDLSGKYIMLNKNANKYSGIDDNDLIMNEKIKKLFSASQLQSFKKQDLKILKTGEHIKTQISLKGRNNQNQVFLVSKFPIRNELGEIFSIGVVANDVTEKNKYYERLAIEAKVYETLKQGIILIDDNLEIVEINRSMCQILKFKQEELVGENIQDILYANISIENISNALKKNNGFYEKEIFLKTKKNLVFPAWISINSIKQSEEGTEYYVVIIEDLTDIKQKENKITRLEKIDPLTGLRNQSDFRRYLEQSISYSKLQNYSFALMYIDINNLKFINDSLGYKAGDEIIKVIGKRLKSIRSSYTKLHRMNGDEFAIIILKNEDMTNLRALGQKILDLSKAPVKIGDKEINVTVNMGISVYPEDGADLETIVQSAQTALRYSKDKEVMGLEFFSRNFRNELDSKFEMTTSLAKAMKKDEFLVYYQPQINTVTKEMVGVEALVRWEHPKYGIVSPMKFIPIAEANGIMHELGMLVLEKSGRQFKKWLDDGYELKKLSINLSSVQFKNEAIVRDILQVLDEIQLPAKFLEVEITESALVSNILEVEDKLLKLKMNGISASIDDFGTGYSSLGYLKSFSVDKLKIDRKFVMDIPDIDDGTIAKMICNLAKTLKMQVVAEGVETQAQYEFMKSIGVEIIQGYYFGKAMPAEELEILMQESTTKLT